MNRKKTSDERNREKQLKVLKTRKNSEKLKKKSEELHKMDKTKKCDKQAEKTR